MGRDGDDRTLFCANLSENVTEALLYELFNQAGPLDRVHIPRKDNRQCSFAFVTYVHQCSVPYAIDVYAGTRLFDRDLRITVQNAGNNAVTGGSSTQAAAAPKTYGLDAMGPLAGGSLRAGGFGNTTIMAPSVASSFADDMQPRSRGGRHSGGGGGGSVGVSGVSGDSGLTQTEMEIQRLLLMSAQMMGAPGSMQPANGGGGGGGGGRGDYGGQQQNYQPPGHHHRHHGQHRRFDDSPPSFRNAPYRSEHDNRFDQRDHHHQPRDHHRDHQRGGDRQRDRSSHGNSNRSSSSRQQKPDNRRWQNR